MRCVFPVLQCPAISLSPYEKRVLRLPAQASYHSRALHRRFFAALHARAASFRFRYACGVNPARDRAMASIPRRRVGNRVRRLKEIPGIVPSLREPISGCAFAERCGFATARCRHETPPLIVKGPAHRVACWEADRVAAT